MADEQQPQESKEEVPAITPITWREFLESFPLNSGHLVSDYYAANPERNASEPFIRVAPILRLFCPKCEGIRNFFGKWQGYGTDKVDNYNAINAFLQYVCRDCQGGQKTFCLRSAATKEKWVGYAIKIGEFPEVHVELPRSLKCLLGDDYELFLKGLQCEKQGLGVGAFTYYRRVVESQKSQLIAEIHRVTEKLRMPEAMRETLARAATEKQFSRAVELVKDAIPQAPFGRFAESAQTSP
jgi:hypothetical protein